MADAITTVQPVSLQIQASICSEGLDDSSFADDTGGAPEGIRTLSSALGASQVIVFGRPQMRALRQTAHCLAITRDNGPRIPASWSSRGSTSKGPVLAEARPKDGRPLPQRSPTPLLPQLRRRDSNDSSLAESNHDHAADGGHRDDAWAAALLQEADVRAVALAVDGSAAGWPRADGSVAGWRVADGSAAGWRRADGWVLRYRAAH